jgi:dethiobiotin synthetase
MKKFFITGTDTVVGKTVTAAVLTLALQAYYWKPLQSGLADELPEQVKVQHLTGLGEAHFLPSVYALQASLALDQAASLENITIDLSRCNLPEISGSLIVEGAGGVFHPLNATTTLFDLMKKFNLPVIIVSRGTLGTINHTLLTIEALRQRQIMIQGIIFSGELNPNNQMAIEHWGQVRTLLHIPYFKNITGALLQKWVAAQKRSILEALQ